MAFLWGVLMFFICHTIANVFANNVYCYIQEEKCEDKNRYAMKKYLIRIVCSIVIYIAIFIIGLLVQPFSDYKAAIFIGNGIGFITGSIHFKLMADENYQKQKSKSEWDSWNYMSFEEKEKIVHESLEKSKQAMRDKGIDVDSEIEKFCDNYNREHKSGKYQQDTTALLPKKVFLSTVVAKAQHDKFRDLFFNGMKPGMEFIFFDPRARASNEKKDIKNEYISAVLYTAMQERLENERNVPHKKNIRDVYFKDIDDCKFVILSFFQPVGIYESKFIILVKHFNDLKYYTVDNIGKQYDLNEWSNTGSYKIISKNIKIDINCIVETLLSEFTDTNIPDDLDDDFNDESDDDLDDDFNDESDGDLDKESDTSYVNKENHVQGLAGKKTMPFINMLGQVVNEKNFAEGQQIFPGFHLDMAYNAQTVEALKIKRQKYGNLLADEESKLIFPLIFGCFGYDIDLEAALSQTLQLYDNVMKKKPKENFVRESEPYMLWLHEYAVPQILLGTIYAYKSEYIKAAYHFMLGLKTEQIAIDRSYCDFIKYVLNKLPALAKDNAVYEGCGFSADNPMGSCGGTMLIAKNAMAIIPEMEGKKGEVIVARMGATGMFGSLERIGSTCGTNPANMIDIYETYIIDKNYNLKKLCLYFNGYFKFGCNKIKMASGFKIKSHSRLLNSAEFIEG